VSGFSAEWLALREPVDAASRSRPLAIAAATAAKASGPVRALDLATGTGSNVRYLAGYLPPNQEWLLVDADEQLLQHLPVRLPGLRFDAMRLDLADVNPAIVNGRTLVTASALLDLVSNGWLQTLVALAAGAGATVLFALSYDGRLELSPEDPDDVLVRDLVNRHQRTDKGFGPALGPDATARGEEHLKGAGYRVLRDRSDWVLGDDRRTLQAELVDGWAAAAIEIEPARATTIRAWRDRRLAHVAAGRSGAIVGHQDLLGIPN
jgi:hypothetical protein